MTGEQAVVNLFSYSLQIGVLVGICACIPRLLRVSAPGIQHAFWRALLLACLLLPMMQPWHPAVPTRHATAASPARAGASDVSSVVFVFPSDGERSRTWAFALLAVLIAGSFCRLAWVGAGVVRLHRRPATETDANGEFDDLQQSLRTRASIRWSQDAPQPVTFGLFQPVVLLPVTLRSLQPQALRAVVVHELFHVQRRDWAWLLGEECVRAVFWFHPAMWWLISRVQLARETVVDELSILFTNARRTYLDTLLALADGSALSSSHAFSHRRHLFHRVMLLSKEGGMSPIRVVAASCVLGVALAGGALTGVRAFPLQAADAQKPPRDPLGPETYHIRATEYYEKATKDAALTPEQKATALRNVITSEDRALTINPDYVPSLIYKNLALRTLAAMSTDSNEQHEMIKEADELREKALALRRAAGIPDPPALAESNAPPTPEGFKANVERLRPLRVGGNIQTPVKTRDVKPVYPQAAQDAGVQGVVIIEAIIDAEGRVEDARIVRSIRELDESALEAVRQWEYMPTLLNGAPVPILMTMTVNYTLAK
jgi:TonB family protein